MVWRIDPDGTIISYFESRRVEGKPNWGHYGLAMPYTDTLGRRIVSLDSVSYVTVPIFNHTLDYSLHMLHSMQKAINMGIKCRKECSLAGVPPELMDSQVYVAELAVGLVLHAIEKYGFRIFYSTGSGVQVDMDWTFEWLNEVAEYWKVSPVGQRAEDLLARVISEELDG